MNDGRWVMAEIACTVAIPALVMTLGSSPDRLGPIGALVIGLAFPLGWTVLAMIREGRPSALAIVALASVLLSGGIGLLQLDTRWFALKEALLPAALGLLAIGSAPTRFAVVPVLLERLLDPERTRAALQARGSADRFDRAARRATVELGLVMLGSAVGQLVVARWIVTSPAGSEAFASEVGRYTATAFVAVGVPATLASMVVLRRALVALEAATGVEIEALLRVTGAAPPPGRG